jgi:hypothetical protein
VDESIYDRMLCEPPVFPEEYLRAVLRLEDAQTVADIHITSVERSNTSQVVRFSVHIQDQDGNTSAHRLFLKAAHLLARENVYSHHSVREILFYRNLARVSLHRLPVVRCRDAYLSPDGTRCLLLLDDISSDYQPANQIVLTDPEPWLAAARSLARFHAHFWNLRAGGWASLSGDVRSVEAGVHELRECCARFMAYAGDRLGGETVSAYEQALNITAMLVAESNERRTRCHNVTLRHGDAHIHNLMFPIQRSGLPVMIDFQFWNVGIGVGDVAHLTRVSFPKPFRQSLHVPILRAYHQALLAHGVHDYSWDECLRDYTMEVAAMMFIPVWQYAYFNLGYDDWAEGVMSAVDNLNALTRGGIVEIEGAGG